jgi:hypothetical protein
MAVEAAKVQIANVGHLGTKVIESLHRSPPAQKGKSVYA